MRFLGQWHQVAETHKCHCKDAGGDQCYGHAFHAFGGAGELELLADAGEDYQCQGEADGDGGGVDDALQEVHVLLDDQDGHAEDGAVGGDKRQEDAQGLIERGGNLLEHYLDHLHEACDDEDVGDGLQVFQMQRHEDIVHDEPGHHGGQKHDEQHGAAHADGRFYIFTDTQERADAQELCQHDIVYQYCPNDKGGYRDTHNLMRCCVITFEVQKYTLFLN